MRLIGIIMALALATPAVADWQIDRAATRIQVDVGWLNQTVPVIFDEVAGEVAFDPARPERTRAAIAVSTASAETGIGLVNALVRSGEYLDARRHPTITFSLTDLRVTGPSRARIGGEITMLGVTQPAAFEAQLTKLGPSAERPGVEEAGFFLTGEIDRAAFGNTTGIPQVAQILPVKIQLRLRSAGG